MASSETAAFSPCAGGGADQSSLRNMVEEEDGRLGAGEEWYYYHGGGGGYDVPAAAARPAGGVGMVRALWRRVVSGRWKVMMGRSGSSSVKEQYGHEEYAQNFDEGVAAGEPENLSRSFSARYARRRRRAAGLALWEVSDR